MKELTENQKNFLDVIIYFQEDFGYCPSYRELCNIFGFSSTNSVNNYVKALIKKGHLEHYHKMKRSLIIIKKPNYIK